MKLVQTFLFEDYRINTVIREIIRRINQIDSSLRDADENTSVEVEQTPNDDTIRFRTAGSERMTIDPTGLVSIAGAAHSSALLTMVSTNRGFLAPKMTTTERDAIATPATGLLIFNTTTNQFEFYNGTIWTSLGLTELSIIQDADKNTKVQTEKNPNENKIRFDCNGIERMVLETNGQLSLNPIGSLNTFIGKDAGLNVTSSAEDDTFVGDGAGYYNTSGKKNTFIGSNAGFSNIDSGSNTYIGYAAGKDNTGNDNTFIGRGAGELTTWGGWNTHIGAFAGQALSSGEYNNFIGAYCAYNNRGSRNIFIGYEAGYTNTTGSNNTFIGHQAGRTNSTGAGNVFVGYQAGYSETSSNRLYIANSSTTTPLILGTFPNTRLNFNATNINLGNIGTAATAGALLGYIIIEIGGTQRKIPYHAMS